MDTEEEIKQGDPVWLKSGGNLMVVDRINSDGTAKCVWHEGKHSKSDVYSISSLTKTDPFPPSFAFF